MTQIQYPKSFVVREECEQEAGQHGFRREPVYRDSYAAFYRHHLGGCLAYHPLGRLRQ